MPNGETETLEPKRNTMAAIAAGVLVIIAGFLVYNYFARVGEQKKPEVSKEALTINKEEELELPTLEEVVAEEETPTEETANEGTTTPIESTEVELPAIGGGWAPNDLAPNSITNGSYTVQFGDTLWEIAEARYGSGFEWNRILEANKDSIGVLPDGSQALIEVGQELALP